MSRTTKRFHDRDEIISEINAKQTERTRANIEAELFEDSAKRLRIKLSEFEVGSHHHYVYFDVARLHDERGSRLREAAARTVARLNKLKETLAAIDTQTMTGILEDKSIPLQKPR